MISIFSRFLRRAPALAMLAGGVFLAGQSAALAETRTYDMWWAPKCVTVGGHQIDKLLMFIFWLTLTVFILTQTVYIYFLIKYRARRGVKAVYSHGNNKLELIWTTIPAVIFILLAVVSDRLWLQLRSPAPANAVKIDIVAYQFGFHIRNPGVDGKLGKYNQLWIEKGTNNFGVDLKDPASRDDYQSENQLTLPVDRPVNVTLRSLDVIHAFYVPEFRMYQDIVPGREIDWVWFTPEKVGHYTLACNQLCGAGHFNMQAKIDVVSQADYAKLVAEKSAEALKQRDAQDAKAVASNMVALPARQAF
jgi:cytochrome c oxidase subunit 2